MNICRLFLCFVFLAMVPLAAHAETTIAVVDVQALLSQSSAAKSIAKQIDTHKEKFLSEVSQQERELRENEKALSEQRSSLSKEEFASKAKAFEEKLYKMRQQTQAKKRVLDEAFSKGMGQLREKLYEVVEGIAKTKGFNLVISKQNVIVGENSIDLTAETLKKLNAELPSIDVKVQDPEAPAAKKEP